MRPHVVDSKHEQVSMFALFVGHGGMSLVRNHTLMLSFPQIYCRSLREIPCVTYGKNYVTIPMSHSWERITSFVPWVTHGIELRAFIARKMPKSMHNMWPYIGKELRLLPPEDVPVN